MATKCQKEANVKQACLALPATSTLNFSQLIQEADGLVETDRAGSKPCDGCPDGGECGPREDFPEKRRLRGDLRDR